MVEVAALDGGAAAAAMRGGEAVLGAVESGAGDGARDTVESMLHDFSDKNERRRAGVVRASPSVPLRRSLLGGVAAEPGVSTDVRRCRSRRSSATEGGTCAPSCRTL